ncbi:hypothetical protein EK904_004958 [Melospiza melodia maxima]|nr:hypothetical protein EK904_004958 [Melospiza melodia maxima]
MGMEEFFLLKLAFTCSCIQQKSVLKKPNCFDFSLHDACNSLDCPICAGLDLQACRMSEIFLSVTVDEPSARTSSGSAATVASARLPSL